MISALASAADNVDRLATSAVMRRVASEHAWPLSSRVRVRLQNNTFIVLMQIFFLAANN
jgi:hypothetical protein